MIKALGEHIPIDLQRKEAPGDGMMGGHFKEKDTDFTKIRLPLLLDEEVISRLIISKGSEHLNATDHLCGLSGEFNNEMVPLLPP